MDRANKHIATLVSAALLQAICGITAARAQASGSTNDIPGAAPGVHLVSPVAAGQWTMPAGDYANTRYSPLDKINTGNVQNLHIAATMSTGIPHGHEGQP
jgi:lanthanide-dependent methanol dehydrogenase